MKRRLKPIWKNRLCDLGIMISTFIILHDLYSITVKGWITNQLGQFTILGLITHIFSWLLLFYCLDQKKDLASWND